MTETPKTPREITQEHKERLEKVLKRLPTYWVSTFVHKYPEYSEMKTHLSNVARGKSADLNVILKLEDFANLITSDNNQK